MDMERGGCIYIMTNYQRTTLYIGVTSDLRSRIYEHREKVYPKSFTAKYNLTICVYYEVYSTIEEAIDREKQLKKWSRAKKDTLIDKFNKNWDDLTAIINDLED
jgi:putative endonuclease